MNDAVGLVARAEARDRWRALLGLALLVALVGALALAALAGARRTGSALDRFVDATQARDARIIVPEAGDVDDLAARLAARSWVTDVARVDTLVLATGGGEFLSVLAGPDPEFQTTIDRPLLLEGRAALPGTTGEIAIDERTREEFGLEPGDPLAVHTVDPENFACALDQTCTLEPPDGPEESLVVTGVTRDADAFISRDFSPEASAPTSFFEDYGRRTGSFGTTILVRLEDGADDLPRLEDLVDASGTTAFVIDAKTDYLASPSDAIDVASTSLLVLALVTGLVGAAAVGQAVSRQLASADVRSQVLADLGMPGRLRAAAFALPLVGAAAVGTGLAVLIAIVASDRFPLAQVRRIEPDPGLRIDPMVLAGGYVVIVGSITGWALWTARRQSARARRARHARSSVVAERLARSGAPPALVAGTRLAFETGRGRTAVPVRSALLGALLGVSGLVAAGVIGTSLHELVVAPERWGFNWSATGTPLDPSTLEAQVPRIGDEDGVDGVAVYRLGLLDLDGEQVAGHALQLPQGRMQYTLLDGDRPEADDEIALGEITRRRLGVEIGDTVVATDPDDQEIDLEVVGTVALPVFQDREPGVGAALSFGGWERVALSGGTTELVLRYDGDADPAEVEERLGAAYQLGFRPPPLPSRLDNLDDGSTVLTVLLAFFALIGTLGLGHAVVTSVRRRRQTFAVWRSLGFTPGQVRRAVLWQSELVAGVGLALGLPVGLAVGRLAWAAIIGDLGVVDTPSTPVLLIVVTVPAALLVAVLVAAGPAWVAARGPAARSLRAE